MPAAPKERNVSPTTSTCPNIFLLLLYIDREWGQRALPTSDISTFGEAAGGKLYTHHSLYE
jgi:hypothetical protein